MVIVKLFMSPFIKNKEVVKITMYLLSILLMSNCSCKNKLRPPGDEMLLPDEKYDEITVFCGQFYSGKRTLCNSIFQKGVFSSGRNAPVIYNNLEYIYENKKYIVTPDLKRSKEAAKEIEKALKEGIKYKIIFVVKPQLSSIAPEQIENINKVCGAIKANFEYGLVLNIVSKNLVKKISKTGLHPYLTSLNKQPVSCLIIDKIDEMEDADNMYFTADTENRKKLINFIASLKATVILPQQVQPIG
jgi:hypothetical protein